MMRLVRLLPMRYVNGCFFIDNVKLSAALYFSSMFMQFDKFQVNVGKKANCVKLIIVE